MNKLLTYQVTDNEISVIIRELKRVIDSGVVGDVVEFGCYLGTTSIPIAKTLTGIDKQFYVYDSFEGLPEKTQNDISPLGEQFKAGELCASKKQFVKNMLSARVPLPNIKKGWFSDLMYDDIPAQICFAFLDGDYYESVMDSLKLIENRLSPGAVVVVDDYANAALPGAARAVDEWLTKNPATKRVEQSLAILHVNKQ